MSQRTPLYDHHVAAEARMVDFSGWEMPINYGSQIEEHHEVRRRAGMFDVSHMTIVDIEGEGARPYLSRLLANDVARLREPGRALYSCMLNDRGGVIDDLITYFMGQARFRVVVNAATRENDLDWMTRQAKPFDVEMTERDDLAMIAIQGPEARRIVLESLPRSSAKAATALQPFYAAEIGSLFIARTGYTGEDGFETALPADLGADWWERLEEAGVKPCGLGARDTLRLEAGMNLYGQDMDETVTPYESGLGWTVALADGHDFIGREALETQKEEGVPRKLVGLVLEGKGVLRHGQAVTTSDGAGELTSGSFSPTLQRSIGLARVPAGAGGTCQVDIRGRQLDARIVKPPFVRNGQVCEGIL